MESDNDDFDIDDILQGLDSKSQKTDKGSRPNIPAKDQQKDILTMFQAEPSQKPPLKMQSAPPAKSVRFTDTTTTSSNPNVSTKKSSTTQFSTDMLFPEDTDKGASNPTSETTMKRPAAKPTSGNDWLGLGDEVSTPPTQPTPRTFPTRNPAPSKQTAAVFDSDGESGDDDLMASLGLKPVSNKKASSAPGPAKPVTPQQPVLYTQQQPSQAAFNFSQNPPPSAGPSSLELNPGTGSGSSITVNTRDPKLPPYSHAPSQPLKNVLEALPFLSQSTSTTSPNVVAAQQQQNSSENQFVQGPGESTQTIANYQPPKKKVVKVGGGGVESQTLTLPSHLIDQEQLKIMVTSLKSLYDTQMDMMDKGYTEQIEFIFQSSRRKEDLLKEEIKAMQKNYDHRLERLKAELSDAETKVPHKLQQEFNSFAQQLTITPQKGENSEHLSATDKASLIQDIDKSVEIKLQSFRQYLEEVITKKLQGISNSSKQIEQLFHKLEETTKIKDEDLKKIHDRIDDSDVKLQSNIRKLIREQQKLKEKLIKSAASSVSNALHATSEESSHKKEKTASQMKEFRKELRRLLYEFEIKNESMQKSQLTIEMEQKNISQTIRDLNTFLNSQSTIASSGYNQNSVSAQMSTMQAVQQQAQNEMETKILRDERNTLSESIAKMQVERHILNEERILLERDKMEFEREKNRVRDLEVQLKIRITEAEEKMAQAEAVRREESEKSHEVAAKMREIDSEHSHIRRQFYDAEQKLSLREQKLYKEKTEFLREKEFMDKLRDQLLCPGCLKALTVPSSISATRSAGDGLDFSNLTDNMRIAGTNHNLIADEQYFEKEAKFLNELYNHQFTNRKW